MTYPQDMKFFVHLLLVLVYILLVSCGYRLPPPGGPEDKDSPALQETVPARGETGVDLETKIQIIFDEGVDKESAEKSILLSPEHEKVKMSVKGEKVELRPEEGLFPGTTYQVTLSNSLVDQRGNNFKGPYTFYFSTGDSLDSGLIQGKVSYRGRGANGAYVVASALPESISYYVQADTSGKYSLAKLPLKRFHMLSFLDQNGDGKYRFAVEPVDKKYVEVLEETVEIDFNLVVIDTSPPILQSVEPVDSTTLRLVFDDPMKVEAVEVSPGSFVVYPEKDSTAIVPFGSVEIDTSNIEVIIMKTAVPLQDGERYWIVLTSPVNEGGLYGRPEDNRKKFTYYGK
jgi:hypothetical protein